MTTLGRELPGRLVGRRFDTSLAPLTAPAAPAAPATPASGLVVPASSLDGLVRRMLQGKLASDPGIRFGDGSFYLPTLAEVRAILDASRLDRRAWMEERFDCDDFAYVLKAEMSVHAYDSGSLRYGLCVGMVWGNFSWVQGYHAVNWFIDHTQTLRFIEPQSDALYDLQHCLGEVSLLLV
jgi:hypothetical protein